MFTQFLRDRGIDRVPGRGGKPWAIAHRGYSGAVPENTMAAIDAARALEADFIEIDVHLSADGTPLVLHDPTLNRTTDASGAVANLSDEQISLADAGSWLGPGFAGQRIPHLDAVLYSMSFRGGWLLLELKGDWEAGGVAAVVDLITQHGMADRVVLQSFSQHTLHNCRRSPGTFRGFFCGWCRKRAMSSLCSALRGSATHRRSAASNRAVNWLRRSANLTCASMCTRLMLPKAGMRFCRLVSAGSSRTSWDVCRVI